MKVNTKHACYVIVLSVCNVILYVLFIHQYWFDYSQQLSVILKLHCVILYYVLFGFVPSVVMSPIFSCFFFFFMSFAVSDSRKLLGQHLGRQTTD